MQAAQVVLVIRRKQNRLRWAAGLFQQVQYFTATILNEFSAQMHPWIKFCVFLGTCMGTSVVPLVTDVLISS